MANPVLVLEHFWRLFDGIDGFIVRLKAKANHESPRNAQIKDTSPFLTWKLFDSKVLPFSNESSCSWAIQSCRIQYHPSSD